MRYRTFGAIGWDCSVLGLGCEGFLRPGQAAGQAESEAIGTIRRALEQGVNLLDLGYPHDTASHEALTKVVGRAIAGEYRAKARISLTVPVSSGRSPHDFDGYLSDQLDRLGVQTLDFCVLGRINRENWPLIKQSGVLEQADRAVERGTVRHLGFSFHDHFHVLRGLLEESDRWTFGQFDFSYMDATHDPGATALNYVAHRGLAVVVTDPLKRWRLSKEGPAPMNEVWETSGHRATPAEWALRYVWDHASVSTAICAVRDQAELEQYVALADVAEPGALSVREQLAVNRARDVYHHLRAINCSSCRPCMPCPRGIDVPRIFEIFNDAAMYGDVETAAAVYREEGHRADRCSGCGRCEKRCARRPPLPIIRLLESAHELLGDHAAEPDQEAAS